MRNYVEATAEADRWWKRSHQRLTGPKDMLACVQAGGSWGNNFSWRRRKGALSEGVARQLALMSKYGICCPEDQDLAAPLPTEPGEWFMQKHLPFSLELRVGFLQPATHKALELPHAPALTPPDMKRGYGNLLTGQARAQTALRAAYVEQFFQRAPAPKRKWGW